MENQLDYFKEKINLPVPPEQVALQNQFACFDIKDKDGKPLTVESYEKATKEDLEKIDDLEEKIKNSELHEDIKEALLRMFEYVKAPTIVYSVKTEEIRELVRDFRTELKKLTDPTNSQVSEEDKETYKTQKLAVNANRLKRNRIAGVIAEYKVYFEEEDGVHLQPTTRELGNFLIQNTTLSMEDMKDYDYEKGNSYGDNPEIPYDEMDIEEKRLLQRRLFDLSK